MIETAELLYESEYQLLLSFIGRQGREANVKKIAEYMNLPEEAIKIILTNLQKAFLVTIEDDGCFRLLSYYEALREMAKEASRNLQPLQPPWFKTKEEYFITSILSKMFSDSNQ